MIDYVRHLELASKRMELFALMWSRSVQVEEVRRTEARIRNLDREIARLETSENREAPGV